MQIGVQLLSAYFASFYGHTNLTSLYEWNMLGWDVDNRQTNKQTNKQTKLMMKTKCRRQSEWTVTRSSLWWHCLWNRKLQSALRCKCTFSVCTLSTKRNQLNIDTTFIYIYHIYNAWNTKRVNVQQMFQSTPLKGLSCTL